MFVCIPLVLRNARAWLQAIGHMLQHLHKAAASCISSSEAINRDEFTLSRISASLSGERRRAEQSSSSLALFAVLFGCSLCFCNWWSSECSSMQRQRRFDPAWPVRYGLKPQGIYERWCDTEKSLNLQGSCSVCFSLGPGNLSGLSPCLGPTTPGIDSSRPPNNELGN